MNTKKEIDLKKNIYPTPWKPTLLFKIPMDYALFAFTFFAGIGFLLSVLFGNLVYMFGLLLIAYIFGILKAKEDPEFFTVYLIRFRKLKTTKGEFKGHEY
ncbi:MAG: hypothetical protein GY710_05900, partial [Desulfobacteraceae bacterium]|nr:hypothetical protein [Desulfobacteraceae bacterium]